MTATDQTRKRDAEATAARILAAAQAVFQDKGYERATTREIAERAGINLALISRYFGSKRGLFEEAVLPHLTLTRFLDGSLDDLGARLANSYAAPEMKEGFDAFVVLLKSISSPEAAPLLIRALEDQAEKPLARALGGPDVQARTTLIVTQLAGLILLFRILKRTPSDVQRDALQKRLRRQLERLILDA